MTVGEFSNGFDVLVASYRRFKDFDNKENLDSVEFNEYEKSIFLTKAQEELVTSLYSGKNSSGEGFEETELLRRYLAPLVASVELSPITTSSGMPLGVDSNSKFFTLPDDLWFITLEQASTSDGSCGGAGTLDVIPIRQDEYHKVKKNPFRGANSRRALRLDLSDNNIEVVSKYTVTKYYVRYLKKLSPIVLVDLPNSLEIDGRSTITECALHEGLHQRILERAVKMALISKLGSTQNTRNEEK